MRTEEANNHRTPEEKYRIPNGLYNLRRDNGFSQERLAELIGVDVKTVGRLERAEISIFNTSYGTVLRLIEVLGPKCATLLRSA